MITLPELARDLSVFERLELEDEPVGVKYLFQKPAGISRLEGQLAFCEMVPAAAEGRVFYADRENHVCVGPIILGMEEWPGYRAGEIGELLGVYAEARANAHVYNILPELPKDTCNYTVFAPLSKLSFDPDVLVVSGTVEQMEIVLRAYSYTTGRPYESMSTTVMGCAWMLVRPYLTNKVVFSVARLGGGHIIRKIGKVGHLSVSIPWEWLPTVVENLGRMPWVPPSYVEGPDGPSRASVAPDGFLKFRRPYREEPGE